MGAPRIQTVHLCSYSVFQRAQTVFLNYRRRLIHERLLKVRVMRDNAVTEVFETARRENRGFLLEHEAKKLFSLYGMPVTKIHVAKTEDEAVKAAKKIGFPIVLKIVSPQILHKSDAGGVTVGAGASIMFGLGGIFVEILKDVSFRVVPIDRVDAMEMLDEIKAKKILDGVRGMPPSDRKTLADILVKTSRMLEECPEIKELDMNPILAYPDGARIVDGRIIM